MDNKLLEIAVKKSNHYLNIYVLMFFVINVSLAILAGVIDKISIPKWLSIMGPLIFGFGIVWYQNERKLRVILKNHHLGPMLMSQKPIIVEMFDSQVYTIPEECCLCLGSSDYHKPYGISYSESGGVVRRTVQMNFHICKNCLMLANALKPIRIVQSVLLIVLGPIITFLLMKGATITSGELFLVPITFMVLYLIFIAISTILPYFPPAKLISFNKISFASKKYAETIIALNKGWRIEGSS